MSRGWVYCALLALQFGIQPLLFTRFVAPEVQKFSLIVVTEVCKIFIAGLSFAAVPPDDLKSLWCSWSWSESLTTVAPPAILYAIQNILIQASYQHKINSMIFNLLNQTKTLSAAFWIYIILGKGQSKMQILALVLLLASAVILTVDVMPSGDDVQSVPDNTEHNIVFQVSKAVFAEQNIAVVCVVTASMISGLSAALTQKVLTREVNSLLVSAQLAVYGVIFMFIKEIFWEHGDLPPRHVISNILDGVRFWTGWDLWTMLPVFSSALGGIIIGLVTQHAGSIMKGFALIFGLVFTGFVQWLVEGIGLKVNDWMALGLVSLSIYIHTSYPLQSCIDQKEKRKDD